MKFLQSIALSVGLVLHLLSGSAYAKDPPASGQSAAPISLAELGAKAGAQYQGDGLSVLPAPESARLRCVFQKLEGQATTEGLWLRSTAEGANSDRFRVVAMSVGRAADESVDGQPLRGDMSIGCPQPNPFQAPAGRHGGCARSDPAHAAPSELDDAWDFASYSHGAPNGAFFPDILQPGALAETGTVAVVDKVARFVRPGLVEEYSVSVDGVRQDLLVLQPPAGEGKLRVELDVTGAKTEPLGNDARLVLAGSARKLAYSRLRVTDAQGRELPALRSALDEGGDVGASNFA